MSNELYARIATLEAVVRQLASTVVRLGARVDALESRRYFLDLPVQGCSSGMTICSVYPIRYEIDKQPAEPEAEDFLRTLEFDDVDD